jgi:hypothetical protein
MKEKTLLVSALTVTALAAIWAVGNGKRPADASSPVRVVTVDVEPRDANVSIDGVHVSHPRGTFDLRGALGNVFTVEVSADGLRTVERVAITDVGALPPRIYLTARPPDPPPPPVAPSTAPAPPPPPPLALAAPGDCSIPFWYDGNGVKHYKPQCLAGTDPPKPPPPGGAAPSHADRGF